MNLLRGHGVFPLLLVVVLAGLTFWLERATQVEGPKNKPGASRHAPDVIVENFELKRFDATGRLQHVLTAARMTHFPDDDSAELVEPLLSYIGKVGPTQVRAKAAHVSKDGKEVLLRDNVLLRREAVPGSPEMSLATSLLWVYPEDELARTDRAVRITHGLSVATGVGFVADKLKATYTLQSQVKATIDRTKKK